MLTEHHGIVVGHRENVARMDRVIVTRVATGGCAG